MSTDHPLIPDKHGETKPCSIVNNLISLHFTCGSIQMQTWRHHACHHDFINWWYQFDIFMQKFSVLSISTKNWYNSISNKRWFRIFHPYDTTVICFCGTRPKDQEQRFGPGLITIRSLLESVNGSRPNKYNYPSENMKTLHWHMFLTYMYDGRHSSWLNASVLKWKIKHG